MPSGGITFLSELYSGAISDQAIVKQGQFCEKLVEGDDVMADRGFTIRHLVLKKKATLNIPSFSYGKCLSSKAVRRSRSIASLRLHVEGAIGRMKTFRILSGIIPIKWGPSSEFLSSSIPSWQVWTAHAPPFREARDLAFCLKVPLDSLLVWASSGGSGETARMRKLAWTIAARIGDKYQIRLTRSKLGFQLNQIITIIAALCNLRDTLVWT